MGEELLLGVREDLYSFISTHCDKKSFKYEDFMTTWYSLKYYQIFSGRPTLDEMEFFMEHTLLYAKDLFLRLGNIGDLERTCALYLLYTLYTHQPLLKKVKIRIELEELKMMQQFATKMMNICKDITFAFYSLARKDAFYYVYSYLCRAPEKAGTFNVRINPSLKTKAKDVSKSNINIVEILQELGFNTNQWNQIEALYNSDIADIKEKCDYPDFEKINQHNFLTELQTASSQEGTKATNPKVFQKPKERKLRLEKVLDEGLVLPSTSKEISEEAPVLECSKSLPIVDDLDECSSSDSYGEEEVTQFSSSSIKTEPETVLNEGLYKPSTSKGITEENPVVECRIPLPTIDISDEWSSNDSQSKEEEALFPSSSIKSENLVKSEPDMAIEQ